MVPSDLGFFRAKDLFLFVRNDVFFPNRLIFLGYRINRGRTVSL